MITEYFTYMTVTPGDLSKCIIVPKDMSSFPLSIKGGGSYHIAIARILGLEYTTYLRFLRDSFPEFVTINGKGKHYVYPSWKMCKEMLEFIKLVNAKLSQAVLLKEEHIEE